MRVFRSGVSGWLLEFCGYGAYAALQGNLIFILRFRDARFPTFLAEAGVNHCCCNRRNRIVRARLRSGMVTAMLSLTSTERTGSQILEK